MERTRKKILTYVAVALGGLFLGWLLFSDKKQDTAPAPPGSETARAVTYTCSMHPQIRQNEPGKCPICGMELIPVAGSGGAAESDPYVLEMTPEAVAMANIQTTVIGLAEQENEVQLTGKIAVNEQQVSAVTARFPGRIERLYIDFTGLQVNKGQRLASVYSPELIAAQRELQEAARNKHLIPELYEASKNKLRLWKLSDRQIGQIESAEQLLTTFDIYAAVTGVVTRRLVSAGDYVSTGTVLFEVVNLATVWVVLDAYETDLAYVKSGSEVSFSIPAAPGKVFKGKVGFVTPVLDAATRAVEVRAELPNPGNVLKPGMLVNAKVQTAALAGAQTLAVPRSAVLWTGKRSVVYVLDTGREQPAFEMREVTLGARTGDYYLIEDGIKKGEAIVTNGLFAVDAAAQLTGNYSMMTPPPAGAEVPAAFRKQFAAVEDQYYALKNSLVASDKAGAAEAAGRFLKGLNAVEMALLIDDLQSRWMKLLPGLKQQASAVRSAGTIEKQRQAFNHLSEQMIGAVELFGTQQQTAYKQYCPMVNQNEGAFWLSTEKEIRNPYYGESMLTCGEIRETYRKGQNNTTGNEAKPAQPKGHQH